MAGNKIITRTTDDIIATGTSEELVVEDLGPGKCVILTETTNNGTLSTILQWSPDGTNWFAFASAYTDGATFPLIIPLVDADDNDLPAKKVRFVTGTHSGTGVNGIFVVGRQMEGWA